LGKRAPTARLACDKPKNDRFSERVVGSGAWLELASVAPTEASQRIFATRLDHTDRRVFRARVWHSMTRAGRPTDLGTRLFGPGDAAPW